MSADNWAICPRCLARARKAADDARAVIQENRRQAEIEDLPIPEMIFASAESALKEAEPEDFRTFREDYEFYGVTSGVLKVSFSGNCQTCDLSLDINEEYPMQGLEGLDIQPAGNE